MGRKAFQTEVAVRAIKFILAKSNDPTVQALARGLNDAWRDGDTVVLGFIHEFHAGSAYRRVKEFEEIFGKVKIIHLYLLDEGVKLGATVRSVDENAVALPQSNLQYKEEGRSN